MHNNFTSNSLTENEKTVSNNRNTVSVKVFEMTKIIKRQNKMKIKTHPSDNKPKQNDRLKVLLPEAEAEWDAVALNDAPQFRSSAVEHSDAALIPQWTSL